MHDDHPVKRLVFGEDMFDAVPHARRQGRPRTPWLPTAIRKYWSIVTFCKSEYVGTEFDGQRATHRNFIIEALGSGYLPTPQEWPQDVDEPTYPREG